MHYCLLNGPAAVFLFHQGERTMQNTMARSVMPLNCRASNSQRPPIGQGTEPRAHFVVGASRGVKNAAISPSERNMKPKPERLLRKDRVLVLGVDYSI